MQVTAALHNSLARCALPPETGGDTSPPPEKEGRFPDFIDAMLLICRAMYDRPPLDEMFAENQHRFQEMLRRLVTPHAAWEVPLGRI
jgi:hypothetical protein